ncbi:MAG: ribosome-binding factor A [Paracoccaceae bacterium]|jgi:ribosome-binding factor A
MEVMAKNKFHTSAGPSQRQLRVGELIRRTLSEVLSRGDIHDPDLSRMSITVGEVRTSTDLKVATAYILPLGGEGAEEALSALRRNRYELRRVITKKLMLKHAPDIKYQIDDTFERMDNTRRLLAQDHVMQDLVTAESDTTLDSIDSDDGGVKPNDQDNERAPD